MSQRPSRRAKTGPSAHLPHLAWEISAAGLVLFVTEVLVVPAALGPFRPPKMAVATGGLAACFGLAAARQLWHGRLKLPRSPLAGALAAYPLLLALSALWSASPAHTLSAAALAVVWVAAILLLAGLGTAAVRRLARWAIAGASVSAVVLVLQVVGLPVVSVGDRAGRLALTGLAGNPADAAAAGLLLLPFLLTSEAGHWPRRSTLLLDGLLVAAAVLSQTLTALVALGALGVLWLVRNRSARAWAAAAGLGVFLIAVVLATPTGRRVRRVADEVRRGNLYTALSARTDGWTAAEEMIRERPLLGVGGEEFSRQFYPARLKWLQRHGQTGRRGEEATHFLWAHCDPLQVSAEMGIAGLLWLVVLVGVLWRTRSRGGVFLVSAAAVTVPFALLHYPAHLAVGLIPLALIGAELTADGEELNLAALSPRWRPIAALAVVLLASAAVSQQVGNLRAVLWRGRIERALTFADRLSGRDRDRAFSAVEREIEGRLERRGVDLELGWRLLGRARLAAGDAVGAETAFRRALAIWRHEEAEMGLGLALAAEGHRTEALAYLRRVCRVNPALTTLIRDADLRRAVRQLIRRPAASPTT